MRGRTRLQTGDRATEQMRQDSGDPVETPNQRLTRSLELWHQPKAQADHPVHVYLVLLCNNTRAL
jgi:hypothetical protein